MAKLIYSMITSLDGYAEAAEGDLGVGVATDQPFSDILNAGRKVVFSGTRVTDQWRAALTRQNAHASELFASVARTS